MSLIEFGLDDSLRDAFQSSAPPDTVLGRVIAAHRGSYLVATDDAEISTVARRVLGGTEPGPPAVGDWVALRVGETHDQAVVDGILERRTKLSRVVAGERSAEQVVAANVDTVFLVTGLDGDFNLRRIERLVTMAWSSGAQPVAVLTKADLADEVDARVEAVEACVPGVPVVAVSSLEDGGLGALEAHLAPGRTIALVGSSGVGKSTLINTLAGRDVLATRAVRDGDDRGRHTTTHRELVRLPSGALIIDNPGIRELQLWAGDDTKGSLAKTFSDIEALARGCRFRDCTHQSEPGCAVRAGIEAGTVTAERLANQRTLERELRYQALRQDDATRRAEERKQGAFYKEVLAVKKSRRGER